MVTGFLIASVYAVGMLRGRRDRYHRLGFLIPFTVAAIAAPIQLFVGDTAARAVADDQPAKFAGFECVYESGDDQTEYIGGICTDGEVKDGIGIPGLDSLLVGFSTSTYVKGLDQIPAENRPPANTLLHNAFDTMVGIGTGLFLLAVWFAISWWRRRDIPETRWFLRLAAIAGVAAVVALECGWIVTEVGRQPWIVNGFMRTADAVTPAKGIWFVFAATMLLYIGLAVVAIVVLRGLSRRWREDRIAAGEVPYGPPPGEAPSGATP
jgi:cytochrome bd ubiquinol oxidase subunit I